MKTLQSHWRLLTVTTLSVLLAGVFLWRAAEARMIMMAAVFEDPPAPTPLTSLEKDAVVQLLAATHLDRDALIALDVDEEQAESILNTVRTWHSQNQSTLTTLQSSVHESAATVYGLEKAVRLGPYDAENATALASARQSLSQAQAAYDGAIESLADEVRGELTESQRAIWGAVRTGFGTQMPIRMLDLDDGQRLAVSDAWHRYRRQQAAAADAQEQAAALSAWQSAQDEILTGEQKTAVQNYHSRYASASAVVAAAFDQVLVVENPG